MPVRIAILPDNLPKLKNQRCFGKLLGETIYGQTDRKTWGIGCVTGMYAIDKAYEQKLCERESIFRAETHTRCSTRITMVTTYGLLQNKHSVIANDEVTLDDLFAGTRE